MHNTDIYDTNKKTRSFPKNTSHVRYPRIFFSGPAGWVLTLFRVVANASENEYCIPPPPLLAGKEFPSID